MPKQPLTAFRLSPEAQAELEDQAFAAGVTTSLKAKALLESLLVPPVGVPGKVGKVSKRPAKKVAARDAAKAWEAAERNIASASQQVYARNADEAEERAAYEKYLLRDKDD